MSIHTNPRVHMLADDPGVHVGDHVLADGYGAEVVDLAHTALGSWACRVKYDQAPAKGRREQWLPPTHLQIEA